MSRLRPFTYAAGAVPDFGTTQRSQVRAGRRTGQRGGGHSLALAHPPTGHAQVPDHSPIHSPLCRHGPVRDCELHREGVGRRQLSGRRREPGVGAVLAPEAERPGGGDERGRRRVRRRVGLSPGDGRLRRFAREAHVHAGRSVPDSVDQRAERVCVVDGDVEEGGAADGRGQVRPAAARVRHAGRLGASRRRGSPGRILLADGEEDHSDDPYGDRGRLEQRRKGEGGVPAGVQAQDGQ